MSLKLENIGLVYLPGTPLQFRALEGIDLEIREGEVLGLIGPTGSGKSTLLHVIKGILAPTEGEIILEGRALKLPGELRELRRRVGLVMQNPQVHLFAETVEKDVTFGPLNLGWGKDEAMERAEIALERVGLDFQALRSRNPLSLSLGEQKRVALAGVLAMEPRYLLLDEVTSGMDSVGKRMLREILSGLAEEGVGVVTVTHDLEELQALAQRVAVLWKGKLVALGEAGDLLTDLGMLGEVGYQAPPLVAVQAELRAAGYPITPALKDPETLAEEIIRVLGRRDRG